MLNKKKNQKGFTLIELLVVIAIIGILAVVAVPALFNNINKAKAADLKSDYNAYKSAALAYYTDENALPTETKAENGTVTVAEVSGADLKTKLGSYMDNVPQESPFKSPYKLVQDEQALYLETTYAKAHSDAELNKYITKDMNSDVISISNDGLIKMTLISPAITQS